MHFARKDINMGKEKYYDYVNNFTREQYDRISVVVPKGQKAELQEVAERLDMSLNGLIKTALDEYIKNHTVK